MDSDLKPVIDRLDKIISLLESLIIQNERNVIIPTSPAEPFPDSMPLPYTPPILSPQNICPTCGVNFDGVMGYVCQQPGCPMGCGPTMCEASQNG